MSADDSPEFRFDPVDREQMLRLARLSPGQRIQLMLNARELAVGLIRGRLRRAYARKFTDSELSSDELDALLDGGAIPELSERELSLKVLEEISRVQSIRS
jgi:hypothetical protein